MKHKSIFVCEQCMSRNYSFSVKSDREKSLTLRKYCSKCKTTVLHNESR